MKEFLYSPGMEICVRVAGHPGTWLQWELTDREAVPIDHFAVPQEGRVHAAAAA